MFSEFLERILTRSTLEGGCGMSTRPEFYSGRGATRCDLSGKSLERIHEAILKERGKDASEAFITMVADIPKLSATDFLISLHRLDSNGFRWSKGTASDRNGLYAGNEVEGMFTVLGVLSGMNDVDETAAIRGQFLRDHGRKLPEKDRRGSCYGYDYDNSGRRHVR